MTGMGTEAAFEREIVADLVEHGGYTEGDPADYDKARALLTPDLLGFLEDTQPKQWAKLRAILGDQLVPLFLDALGKDLAQRGALTVLRQGFGFYGQTLRLAYFAPTNKLNPEAEARYAANRLTVVRQVAYDPKNDNRLDLVLFLNGLPVATAELKNALTGQKAAHARRQYCEDRDPEAPIFRFKERALVHFAVDTDEVWMTTRLAGKNTRFLPFNKGNGTGAGNPPVEGRRKTDYLWEEVWRRDSLLDLVARFVQLQVETKTDPDTGKKTRTETLVFPRYHQLDCVRKLVRAAKTNGPGTNYLVQHSAGSGKSNSIAWLAHRLAFLHDDETDRRIYDAVVVLTDRTVLDRQLQRTIHDIEHTGGVVQRIDEDSAQLAKALAEGVPIIISTLHKFSFIRDKIAGLPNRTYALLVDEAHSSQSGEMAVAVKDILSEAQIAAKLAEALDGDDQATPDQLALRAAITRGQQENLSFFAFTATPKFKTLELFGHKGADGKPAPFHVYSMRQAIEEGFILDVLQGYVTYQRFYQLAKAVADDPELDKRKAARALSRFVDLHPTNLAQKTQIIVEHFRSCVRHHLNGRAKAMVVTGSRLMAVQYKQAFEKYLAEHRLTDVRCLVAFSGEVRDPVTGATYTEVGLNGGLKETELPARFAGADFNVLLVADKYQTGFDQPLLCAMYVDKKLAGIQAVQTLSRLNRTHPGKERTFVLDFANEAEDIQAAFQQFYEGAATAEAVDPQRLYELKNKLDAFEVYRPEQVDRFADVFFKLAPDQRLGDHARLHAALDPAVEGFRALPADEQDAFRGALSAYKNLYAFLAQTVPFADAGLEKLYAFGRLLLTKLPRPEGAGPLDLGDEVVLASFKLRKTSEAALPLTPGTGAPLKGPTGTGTGAGEAPKVRLSTILEQLNERFGTDFDAQDLVDGVLAQLAADAEVQQAALANDKANFKFVFEPKLSGAVIDRYAKHGEFVNAVLADPERWAFFVALALDTVYRRAREPAATE